MPGPANPIQSLLRVIKDVWDNRDSVQEEDHDRDRCGDREQNGFDDWDHCDNEDNVDGVSVLDAERYPHMFQAVYKGCVSVYVDQCPFHLFDTRRQQNISRSELRDDISAALRRWTRIPLTCSEVMDIISNALRPPPHQVRPFATGFVDDLPQISKEIHEEICGSVSAMMTKHPPTDNEQRFVTQLRATLATYNVPGKPRIVPVQAVCRAVEQLIDAKRTQTSIPIHHVHEQIAHFGQYAILSHRWCRDELSFENAANVSDRRVQKAHRGGVRKFTEFAELVDAQYGCRYLWMDSLCIQETDRDMSIPRMFGWYRHAYICVIREADGWDRRGWTLQEYVAARRIKCIGSKGDLKFEAARRVSQSYLNWDSYRPGPDHALSLFYAMHDRETTIPEDMVYCLISALDIDIPIHYGEGFDRAFYRLQAACLSRTHDRRLLLWNSNSSPSLSSPYNSMLAADMKVFDAAMMRTIFPNILSKPSHYAPPEVLPNPSISFTSDGVMHIMVTLHPWPPRRSHEPRPADASMMHDVVFASLGIHNIWRNHVGVLLRPLFFPTPMTFPDKSLQVWEGPCDTADDCPAGSPSGGVAGPGKELDSDSRCAIQPEERVTYERVGYQEYPPATISSNDANTPRWVYIR